MNIGHDDDTELLEEETLDKHTEPQVRSFNMLEGSSSSLWSIDLTWRNLQVSSSGCLWWSLTKSIDQR